MNRGPTYLIKDNKNNNRVFIGGRNEYQALSIISKVGTQSKPKIQGFSQMSF